MTGRQHLQQGSVGDVGIGLGIVPGRFLVAAVTVQQAGQIQARPRVGDVQFQGTSVETLRRLAVPGLLRQQAQQKQAGEALWFTPANRLAEGCISNLFLVLKDVLLTPVLETPVLPGIARKVVLELARDNNIECEERELFIKDLLDASEIFLTNSIMELMPVCQVEAHKVADGKPGPVYRKLHHLYQGLTKKT